MGRAFGQSNNLLSAVKEYGMLQQGDRVLIALSGGADSTALTVLLNERRQEFGISLHAAHLNHCLRGEESNRDENYVRELCDSLGIQLTVKRVDVAEEASANGTGIEETARRVRYSFLEETANAYSCTKIATAHNLNDNAETFIINAVRGAGLRGLAGIPPIRGKIIRPLIFSSRELIEAFLNERGIKYVTDSTNIDTRFTRNKIRHEIIPMLCDINPSFIEGIAELTRLVRSDADYLDETALAVEFTKGAEPSISRKALLELPEGIAGRVVKLMYAATFREDRCTPDTPDLSYRHVSAVIDLVSGPSVSGEVHLPGRITAYCRYGELAMRKDNNVSDECVPLILGLTRFGRWEIEAELITSESAVTDLNDYDKSLYNSEGLDIYSEKMTDIINVVYLKPELIEKGLWVRTHKTGDSLSPVGHNWTKTLKKLYIDMKVPRHMRPERPVIATSDGVCAVPGYRADKKYATKPSNKALMVTFRLST